jgi:PhzF family phenazine biosynthesis protein
MEHRFYTLDVFTTNRFEGNPLAVFTDGDGLSDDEMQAIAREMNLAETVFVQKPTDESALARLRIFTTQEELKLAGHPVIGTWFLLAELGVVPAQEGGVHIMQETGAGILPVEIRFKDSRPQRVTMTQMPAIFRSAKFRKAALAKTLGLSLKDFDPHLDIECVSTGIFNLMVPLRNQAALGKIAMNMFELRKLRWPTASLSAATAKSTPAACCPGKSTKIPPPVPPRALSERISCATASSLPATPSVSCKARKWAAPATSKSKSPSPPKN